MRKYTIILSVLLFLVGCQKEEEKQLNSSIPVISTAVPSIAYFLQQIAGKYIQVISLAKEGQHIEDIDFNIAQIKKLNLSQYYFSMDTPFERILEEKNFLDPSNIIHLGEKIQEQYYSRTQNKPLADPHVWMSISNMKEILKAGVDYIIKLDEKHKQFFQENLDGMINELNKKILKFQKLSKVILQKKFLIFHPFLGYLAKKNGLEQLAVEEEGKSITISHLRELLNKAKEDNIKFVFVDSEVSEDTLELLSHDYQLKTVMLSPTAKDYLKQFDIIIETFQMYNT